MTKRTIHVRARVRAYCFIEFLRKSYSIWCLSLHEGRTQIPILRIYFRHLFFSFMKPNARFRMNDKNWGQSKKVAKIYVFLKQEHSQQKIRHAKNYISIYLSFELKRLGWSSVRASIENKIINCIEFIIVLLDVCLLHRGKCNFRST